MQIGGARVGSSGRACDDMPAALMLAPVGVVPSNGAAEPLARGAVQARAMGKPVILTDVGGLGETLMRATTGWLVAPDDPAALRDALKLALAMPDEVRARLAARARRFANRVFSLEQTGEATVKGLPRTARGPRARRRGPRPIAAYPRAAFA